MINLLLLLIVTWQPVQNAESYLVVICDTQQVCTETNVGNVLEYLPEIPQGHIISVRAVKDGGAHVGPASTEVTIGSLGKPTIAVREN